MERTVTIGPYWKAKVKVVTSALGLVKLEPKSDLILNYKLKMANGVAEVSTEQLLLVFLRNFGTVERRIPKGMVVAYAMKSTLVL